MVFKVLFHGAEKIGKTNLVRRLCGENFKEAYEGTIGADFYTVEDKYQCWDAAGCERYHSSPRSFYWGSEVICLCFDPREKGSFERTTEEIDTIKRLAEQDCQFILVETRADLKGPTQVSEKAIEQFKTEQGISCHVKTSAKTEQGLSELKKVLNDIFLAKEQQQEKRKKQQEKTQTVLILKRNESENNYSFLLKAFTATAVRGGIGLCVAALAIATVVDSVSLANFLFTGSLLFGAAAASTFFYNRGNQSTEEQQHRNFKVPNFS